MITGLLFLIPLLAVPWVMASNGETALHIAAKRRNLEIVTCLLQAGAEVDAPDAKGCTALQRLVEEQDDGDMVKLLLAKGADPYRPMSALLAGRMNAWKMAAACGRTGAALALLQHPGFVSDASRAEGLLAQACMCNHAESVRATRARRLLFLLFTSLVAASADPVLLCPAVWPASYCPEHVPYQQLSAHRCPWRRYRHRV